MKIPPRDSSRRLRRKHGKDRTEATQAAIEQIQQILDRLHFEDAMRVATAIFLTASMEASRRE